MKIAINAEKLNSNHKTGVEFYVQNLIENICVLKDLPEMHFFMRAAPPPNIHIPKHCTVHKLTGKYFYGEWQLPRALRKLKPDVFFEPSRSLPYFYNFPKTVFTVHDLAFLKYPGCYSPKYRKFMEIVTQKSVKKSTHIISVSESTKKDICAYYDIKPAKVNVIPLAPALWHETNTESSAKFKSIGPYFLFIGRLEERKNIVNIIKAYELLLKERNVNHKLVLVGKMGANMQSIEDAIDSLGNNKNKVILTGYIEDSQKRAAYESAEALVFPSLYEGFGLPILEAFACNTPVITSKSSSLPEAAGLAALYVDPKNPLEIAAAMSKLLRSKSLSIELIHKGKVQLKKFSWAETASKTMDLLTKVARGDT